ncbi:MAG: anaerobic C4-dicarboxylate transporter [Phycisphaerales bacterium]|nr:anaerobic C4-dicarboxylate transporter [Phycisphaerales bacterium]
MIWLELLILLACILVGSRVGGVGLGTVAALGLFALVFFLGLPPSQPPVVVIGLIVSVVSAAATMQAAGGLDYLVGLADGFLRARPRLITILAPLVCYVFTLFAGSAHIVYAFLPVIAELSRKEGVRPERPISASVIAAHLAITASPVSAAVLILFAATAESGVRPGHILAILIPATLAGTLAAILSVFRKGPELADDPVFQERLKSGRIIAPEVRRLTGRDLLRARGSVALFALAALVAVVFGLFPSLRPAFPGDESDELVRLGTTQAVCLLMASVAALNSLFFGARPDAAIKGSIARAGVVAVVSILGITWLTNSFFEGNRAEILGAMERLIDAYPTAFVLALFVVSSLLLSQAASAAALVPAGLALGLPVPLLVAMFPAANGMFFLPVYSIEVSAMSFDQTGTTRIGRFVLNHSFMRPGLVGVGVSVAVGAALSAVIL